MDRAHPNANSTHRLGKFGGALLATCIAVFVAGNAWAGSTMVYKCFDRNQGVLYTDEPCRGEQMNVQVTDANPVAVAELQRERDALARSTAQRLADSRRAALDNAYAAQYAYPPVEDAGAYADAGAYFPYGYGTYASGRRAHAAAMHPVKQVKRQRVVTIPPPGIRIK